MSKGALLVTLRLPGGLPKLSNRARGEVWQCQTMPALQFNCICSYAAAAAEKLLARTSHAQFGRSTEQSCFEFLIIFVVTCVFTCVFMCVLCIHMLIHICIRICNGFRILEASLSLFLPHNSFLFIFVIAIVSVFVCVSVFVYACALDCVGKQINTRLFLCNFFALLLN